MSILIHLLLAINLIIAVLIVLVTLMQRPKQEGLGAAFGGGMTENLFGAQTTNVLVSITRWLGGLFFAISLIISALYARQATTKSSVQKELLNAPKVEAPSTPAPEGETKGETGETKGEKKEAAPETPAPVTPESAPSPEATAQPQASPAAAPEASPAAEAAPAAPPEATPTAPAAEANPSAVATPAAP